MTLTLESLSGSMTSIPKVSRIKITKDNLFYLVGARSVYKRMPINEIGEIIIDRSLDETAKLLLKES